MLLWIFHENPGLHSGFLTKIQYNTSMTHFKRQLKIDNLLKNKSFFLFGPRATGKSYLIHEQLANDAIIINLLRADLYLRLQAAPWELESLLAQGFSEKPKAIAVIDEVQKIPLLLDEVHRLIEEKGWRFLLTGSSARKLKRGSANLLAGRAWTAHLYPLSWSEIPAFDCDRYLRYGGLPAIYTSENPQEELYAYVNTYLYEEIQAEGFVRKLANFSRFLQSAALMNGQLLNFEKLARDIGVSATTIREYYSILEDTLIGFTLTPWVKSQKRKAASTAKFYFFDTGICHTLSNTQTLDRNSDLYGRSFEHWIGLEINSYLSYRRIRQSLGFWRSQQQHEVDFTIGDQMAIEVKASQKISDTDLKNLKILSEENIFKQLLCVSQDRIERKVQNISCIHWETFLNKLWNDQYDL